ncbi:unnamed protein product [Acanthoscelides obtectus]|nr:unnamed protein product [Acanthoscelides obtectus]CAK1657045.1 Monocarboxylate transporter 1 [Acanthoscelides obtectus]
MSSILLQKLSYRAVGLLGATLFCAGAIGTIYVHNLMEFIVCFGIVQALGTGLMIPATFTALNSFFHKKMNLMMGIAQAVISFASIIYPPISTIMISQLGFRNTLMVLAGLAFLCFPAMAVMEPVQKYMEKVPVKMSINWAAPLLQKSTSLCEEEIRKQTKPLLNKIEEGVRSYAHHRLSSGNILLPEKRVSIVSLGDRARSVVTVDVDNENEDKKTCHPSQLIDLSLLRNPKYLNIATGMALSFTADVTFIPIIPSVLKGASFSEHDIAIAMTVFFVSDLACRIIYSIVSGLKEIKNRHVFLIGTVCLAVSRTLLTMRSGYWWTMVMLAIQGFVRCLIQTPLPLVMSEEYHDNFSTAYSLYMVVCGFVNLLLGPLMSYVKAATGSDVMVIHLLTAAFSICGTSWISEMIYSKIKRMTKK